MSILKENARLVKLSKANPMKVGIGGVQYDYLAFYYLGNNSDWDNVFGVPYFGNFWEHDSFEVQLKGPNKGTFHTAESAYQASKWWNQDKIRQEFETKTTGDEAFSLKKHLERNGPYRYSTYGGYNSGEEVMFEILLQKFSDKHPKLKAALGATCNAYLLEHSAKLIHPDYTWSDGNDGNGTNHLGLSLMKVREHYFPGQGNPLTAVNGAKVIMACTTELRIEMKNRGLSADKRHATKYVAV